MLEQSQELGIAFGHAVLTVAWQVLAIGNQGGAVAVLKPPVAFAHSPKNKEVVVNHGLGLGVPKIKLVLADALHVFEQPLAIKGAARTGDHHAVRNTTADKLALPEVAHFNRTVDEVLIVIGFEEAKALVLFLDERQRSGKPPRAVKAGRVNVHAER